MANGYRGFWRLNRQKNKAARKRRQRVPMQLRHECLEDKKLLAVTATTPSATELLFTGTGATSNTVTLYMDDVTGGDVTYYIDGVFGASLTGISSISFQDDSASDSDVLELYGFNNTSIAISGTSLTFGSVTTTTQDVENFVIDGRSPWHDGLGLRSPVTLDDKSVTGDVTIRNASTTTIGGAGVTAVFEVGGNVAIESLSVALPGQVDAGGDIDIDSHDTSTLVGQITSRTGSVTIESLIGSLDLSAGSFLIATLDPDAGDVTLRSHCGTVTVEQVCATGDVTIEGELGVAVEQIIDGATVTILAECGFADIAQLCIEGEVSIQAGLDVTVSNVISTATGDIALQSINGSIRISGAGMLHAIDGSIDISATRDVSGLGSVVSTVNLLSGGQFFEFATVTVAPPASGSGRAARATAVISPVVIDPTSGVASGGVITAINVVDPGYGYARGEDVEITIEGSPGRTATVVVPGSKDVPASTAQITIPAGTGAEAFAFSSVSGAIIAAKAVNVSAGFDISLGLPIDGDTVTLASACGAIAVDKICAENDVTLEASQGVSVSVEARSAAGEVAITAAAGPVDVVDLYAAENIKITAAQDVGITGLLQADAGDISVTSTSGVLAVTNTGKVHAVVGAVDLVAMRGSAFLLNLFAHEALSVTSLGDVTLNGVIQSTTADVTVTSDGSINNGARVSAGGSINLSADLSVTSLGGGIVGLQLLSGGVNYDYAIVTIAAPAAGGGRQALARATISSGTITELTIVDPGYGYAPNELVNVTIEGNPEVRDAQGQVTRPAASGARAAAFAGAALSSLSAGDSVAITAGTEIDITNEVRAKTGAVSLNVTAGTLDVSDIFAGDAVGLTAAQTITISGLIRSEAGDVAVTSKGGGIDMRGTVLAPGGGATISSAGQIVQRGGSVSRDKIFLLSGGRDYTYALVVVDPPPGAGQTALARAVITYYNPLDVTEGGYISDIILLDGGWGYPSDSRVNVTIQGDGEGATAVFATDLISSSIDVRDDVNLSSGDSITLVSAVRSATGDVSILNTLGDVSVQSVTAGNNAEVTSERGTVTLVSVSTGANATLSAFRGITVTDSVNSVTGDISIETTNGDLEFVQAFNFGDNYLVDDAATVLLPRAVIATKEGGISIRSYNGSIVTPYVMNAQDDIAITSFGALELAHDITSTAGDIVATSASGLVRLRSNIAADAGSITIEAQTQLQQEAVSGISKIELLSPGPMLDVPPDVTVTIAPPRDGGDAAQAIAVIERRAINDNRDNAGNSNNEDIIAYEYFIGSIAVIDAGRGYAVGEQPVVTITGVAGASARAYGPNVVAMLTAENDITLAAGENITLLTKIHSVAGDIDVTSKAGNLNLAADSLLLSAKAGGISLDANRGSATIQRLAGFTDVTVNAIQGIEVLGSIVSENAGIALTALNGATKVRQLNANTDVKVTSFQSATLGGEIASKTADVIATSTAGGIFLQANVVAAGQVALDAQTFLLQDHGTGVERVDIVDAGSFLATGATAQVPTVTVTIAAPLSGNGDAATAQAVIGQRSLGRDARTNTETTEFYIESIFITNPGQGYALGETPIVTIDGMNGAVARGVGPTNMRNVTAGDGISITAIDDIALINTVTTTKGDIVVRSTSGDLDLSADTLFIHAEAGSVDLEAGGEATIRDVLAVQGVTITAEETIDLVGAITAYAGDVAITSTSGDLDFTAADAVIFAADGGVSLTSLAGSILSPPVLNAGGDVEITSFNTVRLNNEVTSANGEIAVTSTSGGIALGANLVANNDSITLNAKSGVTQLGRGISSVKVLSGGRRYTTATRVTLAAPAAGGVTATARPIIGRVNGIAGVITGIQIINPGSGYGVGEEVEVTITGAGTGASAVAYASSVLQNISAAKNVAIDAGAGITLLNTVSTLDGDINLTANVGDIDLRTETVKLSAKNGSVGISTFTGAILSPPTLHVTKNISMQSSAALTLANELTADSGNITLRSTSGGVSLANNVLAGDRITLDSNAGILQTKGYVQAEELVVNNTKSALPVILGAQENNVERFAGKSIGGITYVDADSFETGVNRGGVQVAEVTTNGALTLQAGTSSSGPLRIVGGVAAAPNQLFLSSGSAAIPGEVEYVVTNNVSNGPLSFRGTLANMIRLSNINKAQFDGAVVPQAIVFDADGYAVETITVNTPLPLVTQPVTIDGSATESKVANPRVEITRGTTGPANGLSFAAGSAGSEVTGLAVTGFSTGAGISLLSTGTTVTDTFVGVKRDGTTTKSANSVGIDISGVGATANTVGGSDSDYANVIAGNVTGVRVRNRASENVIAGNYIGTDANGTKLGNTMGVLITGANSTLVSENIISNNVDGIRLNAAKATAATANRIELNQIVGNTLGAGVRVLASSFAVVGGENVGNVIGQNGFGVLILNGSTSNVVASNFIGTDEDHAPLGNLSDGVRVEASIGNTIGGVTQDAGNRVAYNKDSGIVIRNSLASSTALGNKVFANYVAANDEHGIVIEGGAFHSIGSNAETGNTVVSNKRDGIRLESLGSTVSSRNLIRGNLVGTDSRIADFALGNAGDGIRIVGTALNRVDFGHNRVDLGNVVRFNAGNGVRVQGSSYNFIGSDVVDEGNLIRDNGGNGVEITSVMDSPAVVGGVEVRVALARDNVISGNLIDRNGTPGSTTSGNGVRVSGGERTHNTAIGTRIVNGRLVGRGNEILHNEGHGVWVDAGKSNTHIQGNAIAENVRGPVTIADDPAVTTNVATPVITSAELRHLRGTAAQLVISGTVTGPIGQQLAIDIYATPAINVTPGITIYGHKHIGRITVTINEPKNNALGQPGWATFTATLAIEEAATGDWITSTATTMSAFIGPNLVATPIGSTSPVSAPKMLTLPTALSSDSPTSQNRSRV